MLEKYNVFRFATFSDIQQIAKFTNIHVTHLFFPLRIHPFVVSNLKIQTESELQITKETQFISLYFLDQHGMH